MIRLNCMRVRGAEIRPRSPRRAPGLFQLWSLPLIFTSPRSGNIRVAEYHVLRCRALPLFVCGCCNVHAYPVTTAFSGIRLCFCRHLGHGRHCGDCCQRPYRSTSVSAPLSDCQCAASCCWFWRAQLPAAAAHICIRSCANASRRFYRWRTQLSSEQLLCCPWQPYGCQKQLSRDPHRYHAASGHALQRGWFHCLCHWGARRARRQGCGQCCSHSKEPCIGRRRPSWGLPGALLRSPVPQGKNPV